MELKELQQHIRTLVTIEESEAPMISCYLNLETSGHCAAFEERVHLLRKTFATAEKRQVFEEAVALIEGYLALGIHPGTKGLVVFARGGAQRFFLPLQFRVPLPDWIAVNSLPNIYHLVELKDTYHRYVIMLASEGGTRILGVNLGAVTQDIWDKRPEIRQRVARAWTKEHYRSHARERTNQLIHEWIHLLEGLMLAGGYKHLILAGNPRATSQICKALSKPLAATLIDVVGASASDALSNIVRATLLSFIEHEEKESVAFVDKLQQAIHRDGLAVAGTRASWDALQTGQADVLILAKAYSPDSGWICADCEATAVETAMPNRCPLCGKQKLSALDVKEAMIRCAEQAGCGVEVVNHSDALMRLGGVGCLLRYLAPDQYRRSAA